MDKQVFEKQIHLLTKLGYFNRLIECSKTGIPIDWSLASIGSIVNIILWAHTKEGFGFWEDIDTILVRDCGALNAKRIAVRSELKKISVYQAYKKPLIL